jgi:starch synthase
VLRREAERHPEWAETISNYHFPDWYRARLEAEPHEADLCVAASPYTRESLLEAGIPDDKIVLLPLGAQLNRFTPAKRSFEEPRLRVLFVGGVGQRKGIKYLLEAVKQLGTAKVELRIAGPVGAARDALRAYEGHFELLGRQDQPDLVKVMHDSHVMVLPSVLEGFGLVIPEAMATGLPVIASTHSAAPEIIRDGVDGFVLEPDDVEGLTRKLNRLAGDRDLCRRLSASAVERAAEYSWERHQQRLSEIVSVIPSLAASRTETDTTARAVDSPSAHLQQS